MIIARIAHQSSIRNQKEGWIFVVCDLENLVPQIKGDDAYVASLDELYGIPHFTNDPKSSQDEAREALRSIFPEHKEVFFEDFEEWIGRKIDDIRNEKETKARALGWQQNSTGLACIQCGGPINTTKPVGHGGAWGNISHGWARCADCRQEYCIRYYDDYTLLDGKTPMPPAWSYKDEKEGWIGIDTPEKLKVAAQWESILHPEGEI